MEGIIEEVPKVLLSNEDIVDEFHKIYYTHPRETWLNTKWMGVNVAKCPMDLWQYQEIIKETQPNVIIETGTWNGGSALFLRDILRLIGSLEGLVYTIDIDPEGRFKDEDGIIQLIGSSISPTIIHFLENTISTHDRIMVILDSDHSKAHVLKELEIYAQWVSKGCYLIVEDTNVNGHPVFKEHGPGPMEAVDEWMKGHLEFECDRSRERLMMTFNPKGYYKRSL